MGLLERRIIPVFIVCGTILATGQLTKAFEGTQPVRGAARTLPEVAAINQTIRQAWRDSQIRPSAPAKDTEFCRRLFLDVLGRIPTAAELAAYQRDRGPGKKSRLVNRLLRDEEYREAYASHWTNVWTILLIGRDAGTENNSPVNRAGLRTYLTESFLNDKPYDQMVRELVAAEGTNTLGTEGFNGAVNFLAGKLNDNATLATAETARLFLGLQVQCTQCHNHPFNEAKQNQFWQMNSFFRQATVLRRFAPGERRVSYVELTDEDFAGEDRPMDAEHARVYYELRNGRLEAAFPVFVDGTPINPSGFLEDVNRRDELAQLMVNSPALSRAIVNRMWGYFLGYGFTKPVDDMGPHNPPVFPELLETLAESFRGQSHDLKQLISWVVLSEPYGLSCQVTSRNEKDDPDAGMAPLFSRFYARQMNAEQLYESLLVATQADQSDPQRSEENRRRWLQQFTVAFGTDEGGDTTTFDGTITQTLMLFNGDLIKRATDAREGSFLHQVSTDPQSRYSQKVRRLFLTALARPTDRREYQVAQQLLASYQGDQVQALQDLWWALLNSNEFILIH